jgi:MoCo/4Fe-4S cofactor protein with predicted Tat translocation signal
MTTLSSTEAFQGKLAGKSGPLLWRSLEELAGTPEFRAWLEREFPSGASEWPDADVIGRRRFLGLLGASLALAGLTGCSRPREKIVPYVEQPEGVVPGTPLFYATAMPWHGYGRGILVETAMGRPVKVEGNPAHPDSLGATDPFMQAAVLSLWDPDRSQTPYFQDGIHPGWERSEAPLRSTMPEDRTAKLATWRAFEGELVEVLKTAADAGGDGLALLTEPTTSPTVHRQMNDLLKKWPWARWYQWAPWASLGRPLAPEPDFGKADLIVAIGSDFLIDLPGSLRYTRQFAARRRVHDGQLNPNRLYVLESTATLTGAMADYRLSAPPDRIAAVLRRLTGAAGETLNAPEDAFVRKLTADLAGHRGNTLVLAGESEPPETRQLARQLGAAPVGPAPPEGLSQLAQDLEGGRIKQLFILGGNPAYTAPADLGFAERLQKAAFTVHLSLYRGETSRLCRWHLPETHFLEAWSDLLASDGITATIMQPTIAPLYDGRSVHEILSTLLGDFRGTSYDIVRQTWAAGRGGDFEPFWEQSVHDGVVASAPAASPQPTPAAPPPTPAAGQPVPAAAPAGPPVVLSPDQTYLLIRLDPTVDDGHGANNGWLQELPKPLTKLTWDNAALVSPVLAQRLGLSSGDVVELRCQGQTTEAPIWILPGQADRCVTVHLGYGRRHAGKVGNGRGFDAYRLQHSAQLWLRSGLEIGQTGRRYDLVTTQHHHSMEGRDLIRVAGLEEFRRDPHFAAPDLKDRPSLLPAQAPLGPARYAWAMTVDLSACTGCNACVVACQAENNIAVVGKEQVAMGREMHWIRIDRYFEGSPDDPSILHQPVLCMHCEKAPCEVVCPVAATVHNDEGLNTMIYNRCVGTRYCSNNCPYKVRRFNFLEYSPPADSALAQRQNPNVTVRRRGVMEKCTYCVQRINAARIRSDLEDRRIRDGEIVTACQQACPAEAIVFGDLLDPGSAVSKRRREPVNYGLLAELNTQPRTTYLARVRNRDRGGLT